MRRLLLFITLFCLPLPALALVLEQDTRWEGARVMPETVSVPPGVTLTIAPGSRITFQAGGLEVTGRLVAEEVVLTGSGWQGVLLKNCDERTRLTRVRIDGAKTGLQVQGGTPQLAELELHGNDVGLEVRAKSAARVSQSRFRDNRKVGLFLKDESVAVVTDCTFDGNGRYGAYIYRARPAVFTGHHFRNNPVGLMIAYFGSDPLIEGNRFEANDIGLQVDRAARPELRSNRFVANRTGLSLNRRADPRVHGNRFAQNEVAILVAFSSYPTIEGNDFDRNRLALKLESQSSAWERQQGASARATQTASRGAFGSQPARTVTEEDRRARSLDGFVEARNNWWGAAGTAELAGHKENGNPSFIHDGRDQAAFVEDGQDYPLDRVRFVPWSDQPRTGSLP